MESVLDETAVIAKHASSGGLCGEAHSSVTESTGSEEGVAASTCNADSDIGAYGLSSVANLMKAEPEYVLSESNYPAGSSSATTDQEHFHPSAPVISPGITPAPPSPPPAAAVPLASTVVMRIETSVSGSGTASASFSDVGNVRDAGTADEKDVDTGARKRSHYSSGDSININRRRSSGHEYFSSLYNYDLDLHSNNNHDSDGVSESSSPVIISRDSASTDISKLLQSCIQVIYFENRIFIGVFITRLFLIIFRC